MAKLNITDVTEKYSSVDEILEKLIQVLNKEDQETDEIYQKARFCQQHQFGIEAQVLLNQAQQRSSFFVSICNEILGKFF